MIIVQPAPTNASYLRQQSSLLMMVVVVVVMVMTMMMMMIWIERPRYLVAIIIPKNPVEKEAGQEGVADVSAAASQPASYLVSWPGGAQAGR